VHNASALTSDPSRSLCQSPGPRPQACTDVQAEAQIDLRLIATSDLHATLLPYDYCANRVTPGRGLSEIARQIAVERAQVPNALLFDNGDFLQGNSLADFVASTRRRRAHPMITAFNTLGYDAVTLGNHEFNYGLPFLSSALARARFPVVSANIATRLGRSPLRDETFVQPFAILKRTVVDREGRMHRLRVGVIGFAPPQIEVWDGDHLGDRIRMRDILTSARAWLPRLRARGADVIVALAHTGIGPVEPQNGMENAATALAALPEIDAVIAGHCHLAFPGPGVQPRPEVDPVRGLLAGKPAVMPGHSGSHLGVIDLVLTRQTSGPRRWLVQGAAARLAPVGNGAAQAAEPLRRAIAPDHRAALAWSRQLLGETRIPLHTHFATVAPSAALELVAEAKAAHARAALAGTAWEGWPVVAAVTPYRSGGRGGADNYTEIHAGPLRMRNVSELYLYPNTLAALVLTAAELSDWLEQSASIFRQILPGSVDAPLHDPDCPGFCFDVIPGLSYAIDLSQPARCDAQGRVLRPEARRIVGLSREGRLLDPAEELVLVTNSHRANRARRDFGPMRTVIATGQRVQTVLADHVRNLGEVGTAPGRNWRFLPMPGTSVVIAAGVGSAQHLGDLAGYRPRVLGCDEQGFTLYRLHL